MEVKNMVTGGMQKGYIWMCMLLLDSVDGNVN